MNMKKNINIIEKLKDGIVSKFHPDKIILFGSYAAGSATEESDVDICIVIQTQDRRKLRREIFKYIYDKNGLDIDMPVDVIIYTYKDWESCIKDSGSFASHIIQKGVMIHGRQH